MNIGNIGATAHNTWTRSTDKAKTNGNTSFENVIENQGAATNLVLHGIPEELKAQGYRQVGSWADARTGISTAVYKPRNFDENNPVYLVKTWDAEGKVTEKEINLNEVNPESADVYEMYAYSCYLSDSGKYPKAMAKFMMSNAHNSMVEGSGGNAGENGDVKLNWFEIIRGIMEEQYQLGNMQGYLEYKEFYDVLMGSQRERRPPCN